MTIHYIDLQPCDFATMSALGKELFIETFGHLYSQNDLRAFLEQVHSIEGVRADFEAGRTYWIAVDGDRWIGYCKGGPVSVPVALTDRKAVELKQLYVRREYHGSGVGHELMRRFMEWAASQTALEIYVSCWSENLRALAFYRSYGFEIVGSYKFQVGEHLDDERILKRTLDRNEQLDFRTVK